jgi:hypothetical protein
MIKEIKNKNLTFRTRGTLRDRLAAAADEHGRSLSEEVEHRLDMSFQYEEQIRDLSERLTTMEKLAHQQAATIASFADYSIRQWIKADDPREKNSLQAMYESARRIKESGQALFPKENEDEDEMGGE